MGDRGTGIAGRFLRCAVVAVMCSGCAFTDIDVAFPEPTPKPSNVGYGREIVLRLPLADTREINHRCGMKKNGWNLDTADVICTEPPAPWFGYAVGEELRARGFLVTLGGYSASLEPLVIEGSVQKLFVEPVLGFFVTTIETDFQVGLVASSPSGLIAERRFFIKGTETVFIALDRDFQDSLDDAARKMVDAVASGIVQLMDQYPTLGRVPQQRLAVHSGSSQQR